MKRIPVTMNENHDNYILKSGKVKSISFSRETCRIAALTSLLAAILILQTGCNRQEAESRLDNDDPVQAKTATAEGLLDDYSDPMNNNSGAGRLLIDDSSAGSQSKANHKISNGVMAVAGELLPGRGVPAFISMVSPLAADGQPQDLTGYEGIRIVVKVNTGTLCVQVASSDIDNFDYHTSAPITRSRADFMEVRIPFADLKRAWSGQTRLNLKSITSINLVSFGLARDTFAYEVDEISFY